MNISAIGTYVRLSLEDDDLFEGKMESNSITNQRDLLRTYIHNKPDLSHAEILEFCDDGYSGKNFERPGVKQLLEAARKGRIQCIVVKDISRFGRDYITVGNYLSRVFPFLGVRFIAVNDHYDSIRKSDVDSIDTSFKTLIYDLYSRDLSRKVRSAKKTLAEKGIYINPVAPYGYRRDLEDKHLLVPDTATADVVRRIFAMAADGCSVELVARTLNAEQIPTPSKAKAGTSSAHKNWHDNYWRTNAVYAILRDRQYIGCNVFGKRVRKQVGVKRQTTANVEDWIIVEGRHEPLVSRELFQAAQEAIGGDYKQIQNRKKWDNPLSKKVFCGICGYAIVRRGNKDRYYCCHTPRTVPGLSCYSEKVYERDLLAMVVQAIRAYAAAAVETKNLAEAKRRVQESRLQLLQRELHNCQTLQEQITKEFRRIYEAYAVDGAISRAEYAKMKAALLERREAAYQTERDAKQELTALLSDRNQFVEKYNGLADLEELTTELSADLLQRIVIWPNGRIDIELNYLDVIPSLVEHERLMKSNEFGGVRSVNGKGTGCGLLPCCDEESSR